MILQSMPTTVLWPYLPALERLALALALGLFVGLEREWRRKEAGLRTFGFAGLMGCLGGLLGTSFSLMSLGLMGLLVVLMNVPAFRANQNGKLATSSALLVTTFTGILCGEGHTLTPTAVAVLSAALLAWKEPLAGFSIGLTETEIRSAILLAVLAFVIYPALPSGHADPWGLIEPRAAWVTIILIAGIGFANYVLLKLYGARGIELTGFLGGLVNSTVTVAELASRVRETPVLAGIAYRGVMIATAAMVVRNANLAGDSGPVCPGGGRTGPGTHARRVPRHGVLRVVNSVDSGEIKSHGFADEVPLFAPVDIQVRLDLSRTSGCGYVGPACASASLDFMPSVSPAA